MIRPTASGLMPAVLVALCAAASALPASAEETAAMDPIEIPRISATARRAPTFEFGSAEVGTVAQADGVPTDVGDVAEGDRPQILDGAPPRTDTASRETLAEAPDIESLLSLRNAILLALQNNLDIELARIDPAIARESVREAEGAFDIVGSASYGFEHRETPVASTFQAANSIEDDGWRYEAGFRGQLPFGLQYNSGYGLNRGDSDSAQSSLDRSFLGAWNTQVTLPLMRNFMLNDASVAVSRSQIARGMSDDGFADQLTDLVAEVESQYWEVAATRAGVNVARKSLKTAEDLLEQTRVQLEVGVVSRVALTQAEAGVAERELNLIRAENSAANAQDVLLNSILAPSNQVLEEREIVPQTPSFTPYPVELDKAVKTAIAKRPELARARRVVEDAELQVEFAENQARPRLDLVASYDLSGLSGKSKRFGDTFAGRQFAASPPPNLTPQQVQAALDAPAAASTEGSSFDTFDDFLRAGGAHSFNVGAQVELPFGNRTGKARVEKREIEARRARTQLRRSEQSVVLEVRNAVRNLESSAKAVRAADRRRVASEESLRAEQERLRLGDSTPFQVLEFDEDLAEAELQLIDSLRSYEIAITSFEQVQGTLLEKRGVIVQEELDR